MKKRRAILVVATLAIGNLAACERELVDGGIDVAQGAVGIAAPPTSTRASNQFVPFTPQATGEVTISIDWEPRNNRLSFVVAEGACPTVPCPGEVDMGRYTDGAQNRPISGMNILSARPYTIRIDNWGPGPATASYRERLIPR